MLCFFKHEYAVFCSLDYLSLLRESLSSQLTKLQQGDKASIIQQKKDALNLINILLANLTCMVTIRIDLRKFFNAPEQQKMRELQDKLDLIELSGEIKSKPTEEQSPNEALSQNLYEAAYQLNEIIEVNMSDGQIVQKLSQIERAQQESSQPEQKLVKEKQLALRKFMWATTGENLKELFENSTTHQLAQVRDAVKLFLSQTQQEAMSWLQQTTGQRKFEGLPAFIRLSKHLNESISMYSKQLIASLG